ncbi:hypothetical protein Pmani_033606 [Petrolisthes manimaculis]|uniref:Uncharacterized protein n=1 Tax=Petrolisthes manimaculis TaxID=1843537 RepID=A0AAE1TSG2_9EUCA|nr:hypothetical protein Pmani_033606 [Petrolisthes manimaculis]
MEAAETQGIVGGWFSQSQTAGAVVANQLIACCRDVTPTSRHKQARQIPADLHHVIPTSRSGLPPSLPESHKS